MTKQFLTKRLIAWSCVFSNRNELRCDQAIICLITSLWLAYSPTEARGQEGSGPCPRGGGQGGQLEIVRGVRFLPIFGDFCLQHLGLKKKFPKGGGGRPDLKGVPPWERMIKYILKVTKVTKQLFAWSLLTKQLFAWSLWLRLFRELKKWPSNYLLGHFDYVDFHSVTLTRIEKVTKFLGHFWLVPWTLLTSVLTK